MAEKRSPAAKKLIASLKAAGIPVEPFLNEGVLNVELAKSALSAYDAALAAANPEKAAKTKEAKKTTRPKTKPAAISPPAESVAEPTETIRSTLALPGGKALKVTTRGRISDPAQLNAAIKAIEEGKASRDVALAVALHNSDLPDELAYKQAVAAYKDYDLNDLTPIALEVPAASEGEQIKVAGGAIDPEKPNDLQGKAVTPSQIAESQVRATTNNTAVDKRTGDVIDTPLGETAKQNLQKFLAKAEAADAGLLETLKEVGIDDPYAATTIAQDKEIRKIVADRQVKARATNVADAALTGGGKNAGRGTAVPKLETAQLPGALVEATGAENLAQLLKKVPFSKLDPELQAAINAIKTGDASLYRTWFAGHPERGAALPKGFVDGLSEEGQTLLRETAPEALAAKAKATARSGNILQNLHSKLGEVADKLPATTTASRTAEELKTLQARIGRVMDHPEVTPGITKKLEARAQSILTKLDVKRSTKNLADIQKMVAEMEKFGPNVEGATVAQLGARAEDVAGLLKGGKGAEAAAKMGLAEGTTLGSMKNVTGTSFFEFLKNHPEKEVRAWAPKLKQAAAQGLGAGAEAGMLESLGAKVAAKGGIVGALGGKMNVAMMVAPLLFTLYSKMKESTEHNKQVELMQMQQQAAPTAKDLLERYRAQRFAEQGVNNMPPSPDFIRRLQSMGPQLTKSEVYIGPDRTEDNLRAMIAQSGEY